MSVQAPVARLSQQELQEEISQFLKQHNTGYLGTVGNGMPRVSPVRYFVDSDMNIYIHSMGGSKFENLAQNENACLLVSTDFIDDFKRIKGVQVFGHADMAEPGSTLFEFAEEFCPWPHDDSVRLIQIKTQEVIYVDSLSGAKLKQRWTR